VAAETVVSPVERWGFMIERTLHGEPIARAIIADRQMRIGCASVRMGGIGGVWTEPERRKQGHMRAVMDRAVEFMRDEGFDVSLLFGITDFYPRWGYATMIPDQRLTIATENALRAASSQRRASPQLRVRAYQRGEMPKLDTIYNSLNALRTCAIVRPVFPYARHPRPSSPLEPPAMPADSFRMGTRFFTTVNIPVVEDEQGQIIGYAVYDKEHVDQNTGERTPIEDEVAVAEVGTTQSAQGAGYDAILAHLARLAARREVNQIRAFVPVDHPFALHCRSYGAEQQISTRPDGGAMMRILHCRSYGAEQQISTRPDGGAMMRIVNLQQLLEKLEPEMTRRVVGKGLSGKLTIITDLGSVAVRVSSRSARLTATLTNADYTLQLEQWKLLQLLIGYRSLDDVLSDPREAPFSPTSRPPADSTSPRRRASSPPSENQGQALRWSPPDTSKLRTWGQLPELAEHLFPTQWPFCWRPDWF